MVFRVFSTLNILFLLHFFLSRLADVSRYLVCPISLQSHRHRLLHMFEALVCDATLESEPRGSLECFQLLTYYIYSTSISLGLQTFLGISFALLVQNLNPKGSNITVVLYIYFFPLLLLQYDMLVFVFICILMLLLHSTIHINYIYFT